ncbi:nitrate reductase gamma subunit [Nocardia sp. GAS34]|uniref:respiratory nitrate reductase subunit gamma n=1 Tax=unclassified Nocardia TaxID=2637762 RepID=UPI003D20408B
MLSITTGPRSACSSSQIYESRLLRLGSPLFHFGMLGVVGGHVLGVLIPQSWTDAVGISEELYHVVAVSAGAVAGVAVIAGIGLLWGTYNYRQTVSPWFRSLFTPHPQPELMVGTPWTFQLHGLVVLTLIALWPYTRLVHMFSAPIGYLFRPYIVHRAKQIDAADKRRYASAWDSPVVPPAGRH